MIFGPSRNTKKGKHAVATNSWYKSFAELSCSEREHFSYKRQVRRWGTACAIIAPHGGGIEPGTTEIASAIAGLKYSFYAFDGIKSSGNELLHLTSTLFDEPKCLALVKHCKYVLAIHGCGGAYPEVFIGGLESGLSARICEALNAAGISATMTDVNYPGLQPENICNRGMSGAGVQLEISEGLRKAMFKGLKRDERYMITPVFRTFALTVRKALQKFLDEQRHSKPGNYLAGSG